MKLFLALLATSFLVTLAVARRGWDGDRRGWDGDRRWGRQGGRNGRHWRASNCTCGAHCLSNTGTLVMPCLRSKTEFIQCKDTSCSVETCLDNQLFNFATSSCEPCPAGLHVDPDKRRCVCNNGTTFNFRSKTCVPCPKGAATSGDRCFCENGIYEKTNNTCRACPPDSRRSRSKRTCICADRKKFMNYFNFECQACPGAWVTKDVGRHGRTRSRERCECQSEDQIFNKKRVSCVTCPADSSKVTTRWGKAFCRCTEEGKVFDWETNACVARSSGAYPTEQVHDDHEDDDDDNDDDDD